MKVVLVDARYYGRSLMCARKHLRIRRIDCAKLFGISHSEIIKIENGTMLMPDRVIEKIMYNGLMMVLCKRRK